MIIEGPALPLSDFAQGTHRHSHDAANMQAPAWNSAIGFFRLRKLD
jgi:hypothetical protein